MRKQLSAFLLLSLLATAGVPLLPSHAQDGQESVQARPTQLTGLLALEAKRTIVESKNGIEVIFDKPSGERLLRFTNDAAGRRMIVFVNHKKLATLRLLDPIKEGKVLLTGDLDRLAIDELLSGGATIDLALE
ncbi:MAG: hypothetical protein ACLPPF_08285 [Rhodomicrobium sp.]